jgi:hypothetical protein
MLGLRQVGLAARRGVIAAELRKRSGGSELVNEAAVHLLESANPVVHIIDARLGRDDLTAQLVEQNVDDRIETGR